MSTVKDDFQGSVHVIDGDGNEHVLYAGDEVPSGAKVGEHVTGDQPSKAPAKKTASRKSDD